MKSGRGADTAEQFDNGVYADDTILEDGISGEDLDIIGNIESPIQRGDSNIPVESPIETLQAGLTRSIYAGDESMLTPQAAMADATAEVYSIIQAINASRGTKLRRISLKPADVNKEMLAVAKELSDSGVKITEHKTMDDLIADQATLGASTFEVGEKLLPVRQKVIDAYKATEHYKALKTKPSDPTALYDAATSYGGTLWARLKRNPNTKLSPADESFYKAHEERFNYEYDRPHDMALAGEGDRLMQMNEMDVDKVSAEAIPTSDTGFTLKGKYKTLQKDLEKASQYYEESGLGKYQETPDSVVERIGAFRDLVARIKNGGRPTAKEEKFVRLIESINKKLERGVTREFGEVKKNATKK
jgi:hypothetical protein